MIGTVTEEYFVESHAHSTPGLEKLTRGGGVQRDVPRHRRGTGCFSRA